LIIYIKKNKYIKEDLVKLALLMRTKYLFLEVKMIFFKIIWLSMICKLNSGKFVNKEGRNLKRLNFLVFVIVKILCLFAEEEKENLKI
jgi:hypothetical protein